MVELYKGDCLEVMQDLIDKGVKVDMILTDPPYNVLNLEWDNIIPFDKMWHNINLLLNPNKATILFGTEPFSSRLRISNIKRYKYDFIWVKTKAGNFASCRKVPMKYHELISVFYDKLDTYNMPNLKSIKPIKSGRINKGANAKQASNGNCNYMQTESGFNQSVLYYSNKSGKGYSFHPTQKPVELLEHLIKIYTNEGDTVLDFTMGSGSTGVAALQTGRRFIGIELDDKYFEIARKRIMEDTLW